MHTLLLADDDAVLVRLLSSCLLHDGHHVLTAPDGRQALDIIQQERPHLVVLDVNMPHVDGFRVLHRIRQDPEVRDMLVVMLTGHDSPENVRLGLELGADYYLAKPVHPEELSALIRRLLLTAVPNRLPDAQSVIA
jgi:two-component system, cell cycle response regulator